MRAVRRWQLMCKKSTARSLALDCFPDPVILLDDEQRIVDFNLAAAQACDLSVRVVGSGLGTLPEAWAQALRGFKGRENGAGVVEIGAATYEVSVYPLQRGAEKVGRMFAFHDISARVEVDDRLMQLSRAVEQSPATIVITDTDGLIEYVNPKFTQLTGYTYEEALGNNPKILKSNLNPPEIYRDLWETIRAGQTWHGEFINRKKNGDLYYEAAIISPILDARGQVTHYVAVKEDITERKRAEEQLVFLNENLQMRLREIQALQDNLREQALRDPLTGLYNRRYLNETLEREILLAQREEYPVGVAMIDVDKFKQINDTYGHAAGDIILLKLAEEMKKNTRASDILCRYGGDEFLVVMFNAPLSGLVEYARRLCTAFQNLQFEIDGVVVSTRLSIGVAAFPQHGSSGREVLAAADEAMYRAKNEGRNRVVVAGAE